MLDKNEAIRQAMRTSGLGTNALARLLGVPKQNVSAVKTNRRGLSDETFARWMAAMGQDAKIIVAPAVDSNT